MSSKNKDKYGPFSRAEVIEIIDSIMSIMQKEDGTVKAYQELQNLTEYIKTAKAEISSVKANDINNKHIPDATDELDAIIGATEEATGTIMDSCEIIEETVNSLSEDVQAKILLEITKIYEACSFQDITGQRITKVVNALKEIEVKVNKIVDTLSQDLDVNVTSEIVEEEDTRTEDEKLLNGPQLAGKGVSQEEIDALLASFD